ncbi:MAG: RNA methyltransferase [Bacteroidales bacterium]|nr:RNA methyltransferase [Bacteroidales bacterium]
MEIIISAQNPKIKNLLLLQEKSKARREQGLFVVEGRRELRHCLEAGYKVRTVFLCPEIGDYSEVTDLLRMTKQAACHSEQASCHSEQASCHSERSEESSVIEIPEQLYRKVAYRESTEGIIAEVEYKPLKLEDLRLPENPLIMVLESVEKPGNLGAVLRSADAARADAVLLCDPLTDLYNPNLIRASIGAVFTVPAVACSSEEAIAFLQARGIRILTAQLQDSSLYYDVNMTRGTALVMGTESTGLTDVWRKAASAHIRIPMLGRLDSLNVSVSAAILLFEAVRQRQG